MKIERAINLPQAQDPNERAAQQDQQLREASQMYEQHFMREMVKAMRQATPENGLIETSFGEKIYREQLDNQYVENWSKGGGVGLADMIYNNIRERYFPSAENLLPPPKGPLPLDGKKQINAPDWQAKPLKLPQEGDLSFRFEGKTPQMIESPWDGQVQRVTQGEGNLGVVEILHDQGLVSKFVFSGAANRHLEGRRVQAGEALGQAQGVAPWLQWQIQKKPGQDSTS